jgi:hypothetical protein
VHPRDEADAIPRAVGFDDRLPDFLWRRQERFENDANWYMRRLVERLCDLPRVKLDLLKRLLTV